MTQETILKRIREILHLLEHQEVRQDIFHVGALLDELRELADDYDELIGE